MSRRLRPGLSRLRHAVGRRLGDSGSAAPLGKDPLVSVVVPMYQVEAWLAESLDSVLAQTYDNLEVILVDDGSRDRTAEIARSYVERDPRFQLVQQPNAGLGAARNTGMRRATGDLVAFLDSDDTVPPRAYRTMVRSLQQSGSDFAVGSFKRDEGGRLRTRQWARRLHSERRVATTVDEVPEILANVFAWTKMFRRDFLERADLWFPEGVRYEDQVPMTRAYVVARAFDVLPESVYVWRKRDDGTSITQQKAEAADLHDRLAAKREISKMLVGMASDAVIAHWYAKVFRLDLTGYMRAALAADDEYWKLLSDDVAALVARAPSDIADHVEVRFRVAVWLTAQGRRETLEQLLAYEDLVLSNFPVREEGGDLYADLGFLGEDTGIPRDLLRLRAVDRRLSAQLTALDWSQPARLGVRGVAVVRHVSPALHDVSAGLTAMTPGIDDVTVPARTEPDPAGNVFANRLHEDHTGSSFVADLDLAELVRRSPDVPRTTWDVAVTATALGATVTHRFEAVRPHGSAVLTRSALVDGVLVTASWVDDQGLKIDVRRRFAVLHAGRTVTGGVELDVATSPPSEVRAVLVGDDPVPAEVVPHPDEPGRQVVRLAVADLDGLDLPGRLHLDCGWPLPGRLWLLHAPELVAPERLEDSPVAFLPHREGILRVVEHSPALFVDEVDFAGGRVTVTGRSHALADFSLGLSGPRAQTAEVAVSATDGRFTAVLPAEAVTWGGTTLPLPANVYRLTGRADGRTFDARAGRVADEAAPRAGASGWSVEVTERRVVTLRRATRETPESTSAFEQQRLRASVYEVARTGPRSATVLLECFGGQLCGDSPRAVFEQLRERRPDLDLVWSISDLAVPVPEGARGVLRHTAEWWQLLGSARYLVNNTNFVSRFRKAPGQVYVQTWHGTPLKRIGLDIENQRNFTPSYLRLMGREAAAWDVLVSPSPFCSELFPRAFGYPGPVLEVGYPRNDVLVSPARDRVRADVRRELGIDEGQKVLLYAPTWRENTRQGGGYAKVLHLDAAAVTAERPDVTVLVRGHANTFGRASVDDGERVVDVTSYPDIARLYLASDLLVTDYSSVFFDYALTDRPMVFLVPDLDDYRDRLRGFYLDLAEIAPGPLVGSTADVLAHLDDDPDEHARRRQALRERFAPHDDGHAAERLVERVFSDPAE